MFENLPPVTQGSLGLSYAIAYLTKKGYNVSVPLVDNQSYDLVCEVKNELNHNLFIVTGKQIGRAHV